MPRARMLCRRSRPPQTSSPATNPARIPWSCACCSRSPASCGFVSNVISSGTPASSRRSSSAAQPSGRYRARPIRACPAGAAQVRVTATWHIAVPPTVPLYWCDAPAQPLVPPRVVTDRNRGGAYLTMLIASAGMFGIFLFLTYYLQQTLGFSPVVTGLAFLPMVAGIMTASITSNIVLMPRFGSRPLAPTGMILAAGGLALLTRIGVHSSYAGGVLPSLLMMGLGLVFAPVFNTGQQLGGRSAPRCSTRSSRVPSPAIYPPTAVPARRWPGRR